LKTFSEIEVKDPRPDLASDHELWDKVLEQSRQIDLNMCGVLHGLRCMGGRLSQEGKTLSFQFGNEIEWNEKFSILYVRNKYIKPYSEKIKQVFEKVSNEQ